MPVALTQKKKYIYQLNYTIVLCESPNYFFRNLYSTVKRSEDHTSMTVWPWYLSSNKNCTSRKDNTKTLMKKNKRRENISSILVCSLLKFSHAKNKPVIVSLI